MGYENYITEAEAASISGVSLTTLKRFAEAGYLEVESDNDGLRLFSRSQLEQVFGIQNGTKAKTGSNFSASDKAAHAMGSAIIVNFPTPPSRNEQKVQAAATPEPTPVAVVAPDAEQVVLQAAEPAKEEVKVRAPSEVVEEKLEEPVTESGNNFAEFDSSQVQRLNITVSMLERLLDLREQEIRELKQDREWLRTRVERLEDKSERDQILLLSETQTIRKLVQMNEPKRSTVRLALEWLGVVGTNQQTESKGATYEVARSSDSRNTSESEPRKAANS